MGWAIGAAVSVPALLVGEMPRTVWLSALGMAACIAFLFPWNRQGQPRATIRYGLIFAACLFLLGSYQFLPEEPPWVAGYLFVLCAVMLGWVLLKMRYCGHREIVLFSGFETLMVATALAIPLVLFPALGLGEDLRRTMIAVCFEAVTFLLAMKVMIRRQPGRNYFLAAILLAALAMIGFRGMLDGNAVAKAKRSAASFSRSDRGRSILPVRGFTTSTEVPADSSVPAPLSSRPLRGSSSVP